jgi:hypothetical protein
MITNTSTPPQTECLTNTKAANILDTNIALDITDQDLGHPLWIPLDLILSYPLVLIPKHSSRIDPTKKGLIPPIRNQTSQVNAKSMALLVPLL